MPYGSILGDIAGSTFEFADNKRTDLPLFPRGSNWTDDSVMTVATAHALLYGEDFGAAYHAFGRRHPYPMGEYGPSFGRWLLADPVPPPYFSYGNGAAMRVGPIGWFFDTEAEVLAAAKDSAACTHNHPEGIKGAQAVALAIFLARTGQSKEAIRAAITGKFGYDLTRTCDEIRPGYAFDVSCQGTVPPALAAFLDSKNFDDALRLAVSLGGDADTLACITGSVAEAYYGPLSPERIAFAQSRLPEDLREVADAFHERIVAPKHRKRV